MSGALALTNDVPRNQPCKLAFRDVKLIVFMHENDDSEYRHIEVQGEDEIIVSVSVFGLGLNETVDVRIVIHPIGEGQGHRGVDVVLCVAQCDTLV